jgi:hypothetical protein
LERIQMTNYDGTPNLLLSEFKAEVERSGLDIDVTEEFVSLTASETGGLFYNVIVTSIDVSVLLIITALFGAASSKIGDLVRRIRNDCPGDLVIDGLRVHCKLDWTQ